METMENTGLATQRDDQPRLDGDTVTFDEPPAEGEAIHMAYRMTEKPKPNVPILNRAQRRALTRYIKHKAAPLRRAQRLQGRTTCQQCGLPFLGVRVAGQLFQCQCKIRERRDLPISAF